MMKYKGLFLASLLLLTACDEPGENVLLCANAPQRAISPCVTVPGETRSALWSGLGNNPEFLPRLILLLTPVRLLLNAWRNEKVLFPPDKAILYKHLRTIL
jgi:hypothetical protein